MKKRYTVVPRTMCFVFYKDEVLLIKASKEKKWEGKYNPLGGHIEKGESVVVSAEREIAEESDLRVNNTRLRGVVHATNFFGKDVMLFITSCQAISKNVRSGREGQLEWVKVNEVDKVNVFEDVEPILKQVIEMEPEEFLVGVSEFDGKDKLISLNITVY